MPGTRRPTRELAQGLVAVAPLVTLWIERLLSARDPSLTIPQYLALRSIARADLSGSQLARRTGVSEPAVSQLLSSLAARGLIERTSVADDRRRQRLTATAAGVQLVRDAESALVGQFGELLQSLPGPEADAVARGLPAVEAALTGSAPPRRPRPRPPKPPLRPLR